MRIPTPKIFCVLSVLLALAGCQADSIRSIADRTLIQELMDRYGVVHDLGNAEQYADLFTADGEITVGGNRVVVKGRQALIEQARRDHDRYDKEKDASGKATSIMRHLISNAQISITGAGTAAGTCYVTTVVKKGDVGPAILSVSRYSDHYVKRNGQWLIQRRDIALEFGNAELARQLGFTGG
ncbi:MAG: nuclear transport factor 2 family protein [Pseudomonadota bacterium]